MTHYKNGPGNVPRLPEGVVDTLINSAGVSRCAPSGRSNMVIDQTENVENLVHDACEELLARLPVPDQAQVEHFRKMVDAMPGAAPDPVLYVNGDDLARYRAGNQMRLDTSTHLVAGWYTTALYTQPPAAPAAHAEVQQMLAAAGDLLERKGEAWRIGEGLDLLESYTDLQEALEAGAPRRDLSALRTSCTDLHEALETHAPARRDQGISKVKDAGKAMPDPQPLEQLIEQLNEPATPEPDVTRYLIVQGNVIDGLTFKGPFIDHDEALAFVDEQRLDEGDWWITTMVGPL